MIYLVGNRVAGTEQLLTDGVIGLLNTPKNNYIIRDGWVWAADNGCFNEKTYVGDEKWFAWLGKYTDTQKRTCLFATAPDVVGDHAATTERSRPWIPRIRSLGYRAAFVAQDGMTTDNTDWDFDVLFIGGSTDFKLGDTVKKLIEEAHTRRIPVHVGRVNSKRRFLAFAHLGCASSDGTFLGFGPEVNLPKLLGWIDEYHQQPSLFGATA